jgi:Flp pilus assembly protein TadG
MEFSFIAPILLAMIAGSVEFGRWFQAYNDVNRLATRYAAVYSDCNDGSPSIQNCKTELGQYWPQAAIANIAPQLASGNVSIRMFQVQYASDGTQTINYAYPTGATMTPAETTTAQTTISTSGAAQTGVLVTVQYPYVALFFPSLFQKLAPGANLNLSYTVAQRKT